MKWLCTLFISATTFSINCKADKTYSYPYYSHSSGSPQPNTQSPSDYQIVSRQGLGGLRQDIRDMLVPSLPFTGPATAIGLSLLQTYKTNLRVNDNLSKIQTVCNKLNSVLSVSNLGSIDDDLDTPYTIASAIVGSGTSVSGLPSGYTVTCMATE